MSADALDPDAVARICEAAEGLPLAIVLAAPWLAVLTADQITARLHSLPPLSADDPLPMRHRGLALCIQRSWDALDPDSQRALGLVCGVPGPLPLSAFEAVLDGVGALDRLARLQQSSWWSVVGGRVHVPAPIRAFVAERTAEIAEVAFERLWRWAVTTFSRGRPRLHGLEYHSPVAEHVERDLAMLWSVVDRAPRGMERARFIAELTSAGFGLGFFPPLGRVDQATDDAVDDVALQAKLAFLGAQITARSGRPALDELRTARRRAELAGVPELGLWASVLIGAALERTGALDEAEIELAGPLVAHEYPPLEAGAAYEMGWVALSRSQWEHALVHLRTAERIARSGLAARRMGMMAASAIAMCEKQLGNALEAEAQMRRVVEMAEALGCHDDAAVARVNLASSCTLDGRTKEAQRLLQDAIVHVRRQGLLRVEGDVLVEMSRIESAFERPDRAAQLAAEACQVYRAARFPQGEVWALERLGRIEHARGRLHEALRRYDQVIGIATDLGDRLTVGRAQALASLADAERGAPDRGCARRRLAGEVLDPQDPLLALVDGALAGPGPPDLGRRLCSMALERLLG